MGQAKARGSFETRQQEGIARREAEERARQRAEEERQKAVKEARLKREAALSPAERQAQARHRRSLNLSLAMICGLSAIGSIR